MAQSTPRKRVIMEIVPTMPLNATIIRVTGGPFVIEGLQNDAELVCGRCDRRLAFAPSVGHWRGAAGPTIFVCETCGANNLAP